MTAKEIQRFKKIAQKTQKEIKKRSNMRQVYSEWESSYRKLELPNGDQGPEELNISVQNKSGHGDINQGALIDENCFSEEYRQQVKLL